MDAIYQILELIKDASYIRGVMEGANSNAAELCCEEMNELDDIALAIFKDEVNAIMSNRS